jgi:flagellar assembly factor FliW
MKKVNGKTHMVRTAQSHLEEVENIQLCMEIMGFEHEHQMTRHHIMRQVRILHETVNDLVVELYGANPQHCLFKQCPKETKSAMSEMLGKRENRNNWGFGALPRNGLNF